MQNKTAVPSWNPYTTHIWSTKELQIFRKTQPELLFYDGIAYNIVAKSIGAGQYRITSKKV